MKVITARACPFAELPSRLVDLKEEITPAGRELLKILSGVYAFSLENAEGEQMGCFWAMHSVLYNTISVDTLIIEPEYRSMEAMRSGINVAAYAARELARGIGVPSITSELMFPKLIRRMFPAAKEVGTTVRYYLEEEARDG